MQLQNATTSKNKMQPRENNMILMIILINGQTHKTIKNNTQSIGLQTLAKKICCVHTNIECNCKYNNKKKQDVDKCKLYIHAYTLHNKKKNFRIHAFISSEQNRSNAVRTFVLTPKECTRRRGNLHVHFKI